MTTDWTPSRQRTVFAEAYLAVRSVFPSWGGKHVDNFHEVVTATARAQQEDPEKLFRRHLATWLKKMPHEAKRAPYAFFAQAWGELADKGPECLPEAPRRPVDPRAAREATEARLAELRGVLSLLEGDYAVFSCENPELAANTRVRMDEVKSEMRRVRGGGQ